MSLVSDTSTKNVRTAPSLETSKEIHSSNYSAGKSSRGQQRILELGTGKFIAQADSDINGAAMVNVAGVYQILPKNQAVRGNLSPSILQRETGGGYSVRIIPLRYISAQEMQKVLEPFIVDGSDLRIDKKRNLIIASGTRQELVVIQETIDIFDVDWLRGMSVGLYPLDYVDPKTMKSELDAIVGAIEGEGSQELLGGLVRTVAIERLQSILLISSTPTALREVELWIHRLDRPGDHAGKRLFVYNVQNAKAVELGDILSHIFGTSTASSRSSPMMYAMPWSYWRHHKITRWWKWPLKNSISYHSRF